MAHTYLNPDIPATRVTGRYLAHAKLSLIERAFVAADVASGVKVLVRPTLKQAAMLAGVNVTYAHWARKRRAQRFEIERGLLPLVPPASKAANGRNSLPVIAGSPDIDDVQLVALARRVGPERLLQAAVAAEAAQ